MDCSRLSSRNMPAGEANSTVLYSSPLTRLLESALFALFLLSALLACGVSQEDIDRAIAGCMLDDECPAGQWCHATIFVGSFGCFPGACTTDAECRTGEECLLRQADVRATRKTCSQIACTCNSECP